MQGDITRFLAALDRDEQDPAVQTLLASMQGKEKREKSRSLPRVYLQYFSDGVTVLMRDGLVSSIFVYAVPAEDHTPYADPAGLIDGIDLRSSTREDVRAVLGEPYRAEEFDLFRVQDDRVIHVDYDEDTIWTVTIMAKEVSER